MSRFSFQLLIVFVMVAGTVAQSSGQIMISRLPSDGTWARYEGVSTQKMPEGLEFGGKGQLVIKGELTIRSVGVEYLNMEAHRWIEIETKMNVPTPAIEEGGVDEEAREEMVHTIKMLVPEEDLVQGKPFVGKVAKIYTQDSSRESESEIEEVDPNSVEGKQLIDGFFKQGKLKSKPIPGKEFETGIGKLKCTGINYSGIEGIGEPDSDEEFQAIEDDLDEARKGKIEDSAKDDDVKESGAKKDDDEKEGDEKEDDEKEDGEELIIDPEAGGFFEKLYASHDLYFNDKSPFGLVKLVGTIQRMEGDKKIPFMEMEMTLKETGTGAKSAILQKK